MKVFIAYSTTDREIAVQVSSALRAAGHDVWIDIEGIAGGANWLNAIEDAIKNADWLLVLISPSGVRSRWVLQEINYARMIQKPILPILVKQTDYEDFPLVLASLQYLDATHSILSAADPINEILRSRISPVKTDEPIPSEEEIQQEQEKIREVPLPDRVFIAYARKQRPLAKELAELLRKNGRVIFYDAHIRAGARWRQIIQKALDDATHVVVIWTPDAAESDEVEREVSYALAERKVIVPILSKEIIRLPYHLHGLHYIVLNDNLTTIEGDLLKAIAQFSEDDIWQ